MKTLKVAQIYDGFKAQPETDGSYQAIYVYQVDAVTNSITPTISQRLTAAELEVYCEADDWEVSIA